MNELRFFVSSQQEYEIGNLLGKGGFASVYRARCLKSGFEVALKMVCAFSDSCSRFGLRFFFIIMYFARQIDKNIMQNTGMVGRVRQEVAIHSKLKHPSILELYTFFEDANYVYLVLELAQNGELHRYLKDSQRVSGAMDAVDV